jgi:anti-sigma factor RsiW
MANEQTSAAQDPHDEIWELIPWYVNGTLSDEEARAVEERCKSSELFRAEVANQKQVASGVQELDPLDAQVERNWAAMRARIAAEQTTQSRAAAPSGLSAWFGRLFGSVGGLSLAAGLAAAAVVLVLNVPQGPQTPQSDDGFETLTSSPGAIDAPTIQFQIAEGVEPTALAAVLAQHGLTLLGEPSETGVYTAKAPEGDLQALAAALLDAPEIMFAAPGGKP